MKKSLIILTGLNDNYNKKVASILCEKLAMFLLEMSSLMEFEFASKDEIILKCGIDYFNKLETKLLRTVSTYDNTIILIDYEMFTFKNAYKYFDEAYTFYLAFEKDKINDDKNILNKIVFKERNKILKKNCMFTVKVAKNDANDTAQEIIKKLKEVIL